ALDGYDQALEVMNKSFAVSESGEFEALLGGAIKARSPRLDTLLERERRAALFLNDHPTTALQYRLAEALGRIDYYCKVSISARKQSQPGGARRKAQTRSTNASGQDELKTATRP